jgi:NADPH:quinone reductase
MKAFQVLDFETPAKLVDIAKPTPDEGQVLIEIAACGMNFADLLMLTGQYQATPQPPFTLGLEVAGVVRALGRGVTRFAPGDRVALFAGAGGLAEFGCFDAARCMPLPEQMPFPEAAAFQVAYGTSHLALCHRARVRAGETVLVLGAAGGVGLTAIEIAKLRGATVIAVARGAQKLAVAGQAGADHLIDSDSGDIRAQVKALGGADVVFDPVGGDQFTAALRACNPEARVIVIGFASGEVPQIPANILLVKNITVIGHYWGGYMGFAPEVLRASLSELIGWYKQGKLHPHISHVLALDQAGQALELLRARRSTGKVVVTPRPEPGR